MLVHIDTLAAINQARYDELAMEAHVQRMLQKQDRAPGLVQRLLAFLPQHKPQATRRQTPANRAYDTLSQHPAGS